MASPTPNKGYTYPTHGGNVNSWDTPLNADFDTIDLNVGGYYPITTTSTAITPIFNSSNATVPSTATVITVASSFAYNMFYSYNGTMTNNQQLQLPSAGAFYVINNNSSGAFSLTIGTSAAGTTPTIAQSGTNVIACDGKNIYVANTFGTMNASQLLGNSSTSAAIPSGINLGTNLTFTSSTSTLNANFSFNPASQQPNYISGLTLSTAGGSGTFGIAVGGANDTTNASVMLLASAYTKTTASWALGTAAGGLDTGAIAINSWYHVYLIQRPDTGVVDVLFSLSATAPTLPASYTLFRRIGSIKTNASSQWILFTQVSNRFIWSTSVTDISNALTSTSRVNVALSVPTGVVVNALFRALFQSGGFQAIVFTSLLEADQAPSAASGGFGDLQIPTGSGSNTAGNFSRLTNTSAQIGQRCTDAGSHYSVFTYGWEDTRGT